MTEALCVQKNKCFGRQKEISDHGDLLRETMANGPQRLHLLPEKPAKSYKEGPNRIFPKKKWNEKEKKTSMGLDYNCPHHPYRT